MRRIFLQISCTFLTIFYFIAGIILHNYRWGLIMFACAILDLIVLVKISKYKSRTHMLYNSLFLFLSFILTYFFTERFQYFVDDIMMEYLYLTLPDFLQYGFPLLALSMTLIALVEFANSKAVV